MRLKRDSSALLDASESSDAFKWILHFDAVNQKHFGDLHTHSFELKAQWTHRLTSHSSGFMSIHTEDLLLSREHQLVTFHQLLKPQVIPLFLLFDEQLFEWRRQASRRTRRGDSLTRSRIPLESVCTSDNATITSYSWFTVGFIFIILLSVN